MDTASVDTSSTGACTDLGPAPAGPAAAEPTCTALGEVSWEMREEWRFSGDTLDLVGVITRDDAPSGYALIVNNSSYPTYMVSGADGLAEDFFFATFYNSNSGAVVRPSIGASPVIGYVTSDSPYSATLVAVPDGSWTQVESSVWPGGPTAFMDVDRDGTAEIIVSTLSAELDGTLLTEYPHPDITGHSFPLIADLDGDGRIEGPTGSGSGMPARVQAPAGQSRPGTTTTTPPT